jgi:hypothetical protein
MTALKAIVLAGVEQPRVNLVRDAYLSANRRRFLLGSRQTAGSKHILEFLTSAPMRRLREGRLALSLCRFYLGGHGAVASC